MDPYPGSPVAPLSLHRYAYAADDPVNAVDPTGAFTLSDFLTSTWGAMLIGSAFGGAIGAEVTGTVKGTIAGAVAGAALGFAFVLGNWALLFKAVLTGVVQGILQVLADYVTHSSLQYSESFLRGFSKGAWGTVLKVIFPFSDEILVAAGTALAFSLSESFSDGITDIRRILVRATKEVVMSVLANMATGPSLPLTVRARISTEISDTLAALYGGIISFELPIIVSDAQGVLSFFGYHTWDDYWKYPINNE
jgi:hypothetical protein